MKTFPYLITVAIITLLGGGARGQAPTEARAWVDQEGRSVRAAFVKLDGEAVVLRLENGSQATVPLARLSAGDQQFARAVGSRPTAAAANPGATAASAVALVWPPNVSVNTKDLEITLGEQNAAERRFVYKSGSFQFESQAPLTGTVMREIARDFELVHTLFKQLPWGWEPKPRRGHPLFVAKLYETERDFIAGGGSDNSSGGSKDDHIFTKFSALGLKKVGERYAFDAKSRTEGDMIGLIGRLVMADMRSLAMPWSGMGLEEFLEHVAYRNGSFVLKSPDGPLKARLAARAKSGVVPDVDRMLKFFRAQWSEIGGANSVQIRMENYMDAGLLIYFFGYLDGEGQGARLHQYFQAMARDATSYREYVESDRKLRLAWRGSFAERTLQLHKDFIGDRSDAELKQAMEAKFKSIGIKL